MFLSLSAPHFHHGEVAKDPGFWNLPVVLLASFGAEQVFVDVDNRIIWSFYFVTDALMFLFWLGNYGVSFRPILSHVGLWVRQGRAGMTEICAGFLPIRRAVGAALRFREVALGEPRKVPGRIQVHLSNATVRHTAVYADYEMRAVSPSNRNM